MTCPKKITIEDNATEAYSHKQKQILKWDSGDSTGVGTGEGSDLTSATIWLFDHRQVT